MKTLTWNLKLAAVVLLFASLASAQLSQLVTPGTQHITPALDTVNAFTNQNKFPGFVLMNPITGVPYTVATLPTWGTGAFFIVVDGQTQSDCTTGGGSSIAICYYYQSAWNAIGGGGGGGGGLAGVVLPTTDFSVSGSSTLTFAWGGSNTTVGPTSGNTVNAIVKRDSNGDIIIHTVTATGQVTLTGAGTNITLTPNGGNVISAAPLVLPAGTACTNPFLQVSGTGNTGFAQISTAGWAYCSTGSEIVDWYGSGERIGNAKLFGWSSAAGANSNPDTAMSREAPGIIDFGNGTPQDNTALFRSGMTQQVTTDFTTANNTNLQAFLSWSLPSDATRAEFFSFHCAGTYSQATANVAVAFGIQAATNAPNFIDAVGLMDTSATARTTGSSPPLRGLTTTTATNIVSATPSATATFFRFELDGTLQNNSGTANVINIMVSTANGTDAVTIGRGAYCMFTP